MKTKSIGKRVRAGIFASFMTLTLVALGCAHQQGLQGDKATFVILMIGDGMGGWHVDATRRYLDDGPLAMETLEHHGYMTTFMRNPAEDVGAYTSDEEYWDDPSQTGSYDPILGGKTPWDMTPVPEYVQQGATDSAAAASAIYSGEKTCKYCLNVAAKEEGYPHNAPFSVKYLLTILDHTQAMGKAAGLVTSVPFNHATPAAAVAKTQHRKNDGEKSRQMIYSDVDVIMGAGHPCYDDNGQPQTCDYVKLQSNIGEYLDDGEGEALFKLIAAGFRGRVFVEKRADFEDLADGDRLYRGRPMPLRVFGLAQVANTLQYERHMDDGDATDDWKVGGQADIRGVPNLKTMTQGALAVLEQDEEGFWLMVEGGAIDWASHANDMTRMLEETIDFDDAVQAVIDWVEAPSNGSDWTNTLLIVTADHECGHLQPVGEVVGDKVISNQSWGVKKMAEAGTVTCLGWNQHTNSLVPIYAQGVGAEALPARYEGDYRDNTDIFNVMYQSMRGGGAPLEFR
ncbi:MAG: alkaline phosphatase [Thermodesulfobacteriota bacterium]|nr:alkaline phosphatase [Thermodesulfobacteriota bacterium]